MAVRPALANPRPLKHKGNSLAHMCESVVCIKVQRIGCIRDYTSLTKANEDVEHRDIDGPTAHTCSKVLKQLSVLSVYPVLLLTFLYFKFSYSIVRTALAPKMKAQTWTAVPVHILVSFKQTRKKKTSKRGTGPQSSDCVGH